ncbi:UNVERIFIED_CONTAM: Copia protein [Sesamum calycinum]|uniref:Copia protein n=1 Tax=Sesamum calycinum TaxID=2727403 RepID=A0AAW2JVI2_9LAMI
MGKGDRLTFYNLSVKATIKPASQMFGNKVENYVGMRLNIIGIGDEVYTIVIHYLGKGKRLCNIDPDKYSHMDFIEDIKDLHGDKGKGIQKEGKGCDSGDEMSEEEREDCDEDSSTEEGEGSHQEWEENDMGDELSSYNLMTIKIGPDSVIFIKIFLCYVVEHEKSNGDRLAFNELHGSCKLDGQNYAMWHRQIQYFLHHKKILDHLTTSTAEPIETENGQTAQYRRELDAYNKWLEQDMSARFIMLSCMHDNLIREYEKYPTAKEFWEVLKVAYGSTSATRLRALTLSVASHLKLEADRRESECAQQAAFVAHTDQRKLHKGKRWNKSTGAGPSNSQSKSKTWPHKMGHFARECTEPNRYRRNKTCDKGSSRIRKLPSSASMQSLHCYGNGAQEEVLGIGSYQLKLSTGCELLLSDVQYAPNIQCNLLSVTTLMGQGFSFLFEQMHARLGHKGQERMTRLAREGLLGSLAKVNHPVCEPCMAGKACRKPFGKAKRPTRPLELVHSDICGPMNVRACHGAFYFLTFIDDYSRYGSVYLLSHRSEALECFKRFLGEVENQREMNFKVLRTDRGREYLSEQFKRICEDKGIIRHLTIPYAPQQNGVAERRNQTLLEMARSMMAQANLPISFWGDAILTAAYILNRVPSKSIPSTPYELWHGRSPV